MSSTAALADHQRRTGQLGQLHAHRTPPAARATARPTFGLADVVRLPGAAERALATDGPKLQARDRICLPRCLAALGWEQGEQVQLVVRGSTVILGRDLGRGKTLKVNSGGRIYLPRGCVAALGAVQGDTLLGLVPSDGTHLVLLGPASVLEVADLLARPDHIRNLVDSLADDTTLAAGRAIQRLTSTLSEAELVALASISRERLAELGLTTGAPNQEVR